MKLQLIKTGLTNDTVLFQIPSEILDPLEIELINCYKQQKLITEKPTLKTIAQELLTSSKNVDALKVLFKGLVDARSMDRAEWEIALFKSRSQATTKLIQQLAEVEEGDQKTRAQIINRIVELGTKKEMQYHDPINAKNWEALTHAEEEEIYLAIDWLKDNDVPLKKNVLYAFIATTNGGKTILKTWFSYKLIEAGKTVLYLAQEEPYTDTIRRIHQTTLGITESQYKELTKETFEHVTSRFTKHAEDNGFGDIHVAEWTGIRVGTIEDKIKELKELHGVTIDALVVDYGKLVDTTNTKKNSQEWERIGSIFQELKQLAMKQHIVVLTSIQLNRESSQKLVQNGVMADLFDVAGAYEAVTHANYVWSVRLQGRQSEDINYDDPESIQGMYTLMVQKQKYGKLRKLDSKNFHWRTDHQLIESNIDVISLPEL